MSLGCCETSREVLAEPPGSGTCGVKQEADRQRKFPRELEFVDSACLKLKPISLWLCRVLSLLPVGAETRTGRRAPGGPQPTGQSVRGLSCDAVPDLHPFLFVEPECWSQLPSASLSVNRGTSRLLSAPSSPLLTWPSARRVLQSQSCVALGRGDHRLP